MQNVMEHLFNTYSPEDNHRGITPCSSKRRHVKKGFQQMAEKNIASHY